MNRAHIEKFIDVATRTIAPICPHFAEHVWRKLLQKPGSVTRAGWPKVKSPDKALRRAATYLDELKDTVRRTVQRLEHSKQKKGWERKVACVRLYVVEEFVGWQRAVLNILATTYDENKDTFPEQDELVERVKNSEHFGGSSNIKQVMKQVMPFMRHKMQEANRLGASALDVRLPFDEMAVLQENAPSIARNAGVQKVEVMHASEERVNSASKHVKVSQSEPASPAMQMIFEGDEEADTVQHQQQQAQKADSSSAKCASTSSTLLTGDAESEHRANGDLNPSPSHKGAGKTPTAKDNQQNELLHRSSDCSSSDAAANIYHSANGSNSASEQKGKNQQQQQKAKGQKSDAAGAVERTPEPIAVVTKGSVAEEVLHVLEAKTRRQTQIEHGDVEKIRLGSDEYTGLNAMIRCLTFSGMPHEGAMSNLSNEEMLKADELMDTTLQEILPGIAAGNVREVRRGMAVIESSCVCNVSSSADKVNAADVVFAVCARRAELMVREAGARPALPSQCARALANLRSILHAEDR